MFKKGFTLIELLVVIAIIGVLASIIIASLSGAKARARDAKRIADIKTLQLSLELYYNDKGQFPANLNALVSDGYLASLPADPGGSGACTDGTTHPNCYYYEQWGLLSGLASCPVSNPPIKYHLAAVLEQIGNAALTQDANLAPAGTGNAALYRVCSTSDQNLNFNGKTTSCTAGVNTSPEGCYDQTN